MEGGLLVNVDKEYTSLEEVERVKARTDREGDPLANVEEEHKFPRGRNK